MKRCLPLLALLLALGAAGPARAADVVRDSLAAPAACPPLLLDPADFGAGATVVYPRVPTAAEIHDLQYLDGVAHVLLALPDWPAGYDEIEALSTAVLPEGADLVVVLPGYPATHRAAEAWNLLKRPLRIVMIVNEPPADREMIYQLNAIRGLERVVADLPRPSRSGFERLQRPLSFRVLMR